MPDIPEYSHSQIEDVILTELQSLKQRLQKLEDRKPWFVNIIAGVTIIAAFGFASFLGGLYYQINAVSAKVDQVHATVSEANGSLKERTSVIETKLAEIDKKLDRLVANSSSRTR